MSRKTELPGFDVRAYLFMVDDEITPGVSAAVHHCAQLYFAITGAITHTEGVPRADTMSDSQVQRAPHESATSQA